MAEEELLALRPTLAAEHLERRGIEMRRETLRRWMLGEGLWRARRQRIEQIHTSRERRAPLESWC